MKKSISLPVAILVLVVMLSSCAQNAKVGAQTPDGASNLTWQEQYDLGIRYLSEGNYEEAIIAFTAAIEIDPKQAAAYVGRGDAYIGLGETDENLAAAQADYEQAIELDGKNVRAYLGLADVFIHKEDYDKALEILKQGLESTENDPSIVEKLATLEDLVSSSNTLSSMSDETDGLKPNSDGPTETISIPLTVSIIESEGDIYNYLELFYEVAVTNGQYDSRSSSSIISESAEGTSTTTLYGQINVQCEPLISGDPYIVRGEFGTDLQELKSDLALLCPPQYMDSTDRTMENLHYESYDEFFEYMCELKDHGGEGFGNTDCLFSDEWFLVVACYDSSGNRMGYAVYQTDISEIEHIKELYMVTVNTRADGSVS